MMRPFHAIKLLAEPPDSNRLEGKMKYSAFVRLLDRIYKVNKMN